MKKIFILLLFVFMLAFVSCDNETNTPTIEEGVGELIIPDMHIYTNFPDTPQPKFTNPKYESEITYKILDDDNLRFVDGYFMSDVYADAIVEAKTEFHTTSFQVVVEEYKDQKESFYLSRIASVEQRWISSGKPEDVTLFIGDSFFDTEFWSNFYQTFDGGDVFTHGVSSSTSTDWEKWASRLIYPVKPSNIVMHIGTNNLYDDREAPSVVSENVIKLFEQIHARLPETKIYYFAIEPRTYGIGSSTFNKASYDLIYATNTLIESYISDSNYIEFLDATSYCYTSGFLVNSSFFRDGTHPTLNNYSVYVNLLKEAGLNI